MSLINDYKYVHNCKPSIKKVELDNNRDIENKKKMLQAAIVDKKIYNLSKLARDLMVDRRTLRLWLDKFYENGVEGLYAKYTRKHEVPERIITRRMKLYIKEKVNSYRISGEKVPYKLLLREIGDHFKVHLNYNTLYKAVKRIEKENT